MGNNRCMYIAWVRVHKYFISPFVTCNVSFILLLLFMRQRVVCAMLWFLSLCRSNRDVFAFWGHKKCIKTHTKNQPKALFVCIFVAALHMLNWSFLTVLAVFICTWHTYFLLIAPGNPLGWVQLDWCAVNQGYRPDSPSGRPIMECRVIYSVIGRNATKENSI